MRKFNEMIKSIFVIITVFLNCFFFISAKSTPPNIVYILADDMGVGDVKCLNPEAKVKTPHIDGLAKNGMTFIDAHTSSAVCTPTRYGLMTGRYNWRSPLKNGVLQGYSSSLIPKGRDTVASLLKRNGYNTAMIGKSHLGFNWMLKTGGRLDVFKAEKTIETNIDFTKEYTGGPCDWGFDYFYGVAASLDFPPYVMLENNKVTEVPTVLRPSQGGKKRNAPALMMRAGLQTKDFKPEMVLKKLTEMTTSYINSYRGRKPFFIYMPLTAPHTPVIPREEFLNSSKAGIYGDFIQEVDWSVGQVIEALKKKKLLKNTIIVFTADNGASKSSFTPEEEEQYNHHPSHIYNGRKGSLLEGGHRVPFLVQWPVGVKAGSQTTKACSLNDLYATCAEIVGEKIVPDAGEDSTSILPLLKGKAQDYKQTRFVHHDFGGRFAYRSGKWKLILSSVDERKALYDLEADVSERKNLYKESPEIVERLREELTDIIKNGRSTKGPVQKNDKPAWWKQLFWIDAGDLD